MLNSSAKLNKKIFQPNVTKHPLRDGFGEAMLECGRKNKNVVLLCADLIESTRSHHFKTAFPDRFFEVGVAEQNLAAAAAGFSLGGKIPFLVSYATFSPGRNLEQLRTLAAYSNLNLKIMGHHAGLSVGPDGATHQALEDIALMRTLPNLTVLVPSDEIEAGKAVLAAAKISGPVYVRLARAATPVITTAATPFIPGRAITLWRPRRGLKSQVSIIGAGPILYEALQAARILEQAKIGVTVTNFHTVKPIDKAKLISLAKDTGRVITVEEHQIAGGLGSYVAEILSAEHPTLITRIGVNDQFGRSGSSDELMSAYGLDRQSIESAVRTLLKKKLK